MVQRRGGAGFTPEALQRGWVLARGFGQQLDGNGAAQLLVFGLIDHAHSALAQAANDPVVAPQRTGSQFLHDNHHAAPRRNAASAIRIEVGSRQHARQFSGLAACKVFNQHHVRALAQLQHPQEISRR